MNNAVISLLDPDTDAIVRAIWREIGDELGVRAVWATAHPHLTYLGSSHSDTAGLAAHDRAVEAAAHEIPAFAVRACGLAFFDDPAPVAYLAVEPSAALRAAHACIWRHLAATPAFEDRAPLYRPGVWVPHVALAVHDLRPEHSDAVRAIAARHPLERDIHVTNVAILHRDGPRYRVLEPHCLRPEAA